jgi:hypothetical protein
MKKSTIIIAAVLVATTLMAGQASAQSDHSRISIRVASYEILFDNDDRNYRNNDDDDHGHHRHHRRHHSHNNYRGRIGGYETGFGGFRTTSATYAGYPAAESGFMDLNMGKSIHIALNLFSFSAPFTRNNVFGISAAAGLSMSNFVFSTPMAYVKSDKLLRPVDAGHYLKKAKLNTFAIHFPVALEVNPVHDFFFSVGGYADLVVGSHMKWKFPKEKLHGLGTNFLQAGVTARMGFHNVYAFANYGLTEIFKTGYGPAVNPYTFGIGFGF